MTRGQIGSGRPDENFKGDESQTTDPIPFSGAATYRIAISSAQHSAYLDKALPIRESYDSK